ncbi:hypothetical protein J1605_015224 [Eschrichtius robustus]|uniref:Uncharacterized protein n=1 Tax=Eschrichtius robustus TaxID=9764 RepID=A0AB34GCT2_ESCRO|nr:hypothetical protein J1605_015224 [Eschrichtius robustus]
MDEPLVLVVILCVQVEEAGSEASALALTDHVSPGGDALLWTLRTQSSIRGSECSGGGREGGCWARVNASSRAVRMFRKNFSARLVSDYEIYWFYYLELLPGLSSGLASFNPGIQTALPPPGIWGPSSEMELRRVDVRSFKDEEPEGFPGGAVVENLPANAGDTGLSPGPGRSHMLRSNWAREPQLLSLCVWSLCSATREAATVRGPRTAMRSGPRLPQLEKALTQK